MVPPSSNPAHVAAGFTPGSSSQQPSHENEAKTFEWLLAQSPGFAHVQCELKCVKKNQRAFTKTLDEVRQLQDSGFVDLKSMASTLLILKRGTASPASSPRRGADDGITLPTTSARPDVISRQAHDLFVKNCGLNSASGALKKVFPAGSSTMSKSDWVSKIAATRRASFWQRIASHNLQDHHDDPNEIVEELLNGLATPEPNASSQKNLHTRGLELLVHQRIH